MPSSHEIYEHATRIRFRANHPAGKRDCRANAKANAGPKLRATNVNFFYGSSQALYDISLDMHANRITALIGPSGCGKSTFLRSLNRINDTIRNSHLEGQVLLDNENVGELDVTSLRRRVGMVFQRPNPFPKSILRQHRLWAAH